MRLQAFNAAADGVLAYFEVTVMSGGAENWVAVGVVGEGHGQHRMPGWEPGSFGFHSDDGSLYEEQDQEGACTQGLTPWGVGEVVGCGYDLKSGSLFWTQNGDLLPLRVDKLAAAAPRSLYAAVGLGSSGPLGGGA